MCCLVVTRVALPPFWIADQVRNDGVVARVYVVRSRICRIMGIFRIGWVIAVSMSFAKMSAFSTQSIGTNYV